MLSRYALRINTHLERYFPEQRLYLKSDQVTRFVRLRPATQAIALVVGTLGLAWTIVATALIMMETIGAGSAREQSARQGVIYESRLAAIATDRDQRAEEAVRAQERFNIALAQVSAMQEKLLASEDRRRELETGIEVIQNTLRRTMAERDEARDDADRVKLALDEKGGGATELGRIHDTAATLGYLTGALGATARERDAKEAAADAALAEVAEAEARAKDLRLRNDAIFARLEEAVTISMEPLDDMFRSAGMDPQDLLDSVRKGYSGQGGPLTPIAVSTKGGLLLPEEVRANAILEGLDRMNLYRIAAFQVPFGLPVKDSFRWTSGFGVRNDPKGAGRRMHEGTDMAGAYGTPVYVTADGTVISAGWHSGYGRHIEVRHAGGIVSTYSHLSQIRVEVGQRVSRGERIGDMGNSGRSTGTHLHYEVHIGGVPVNPMTFIKAADNVF